MLSVCVIFTKLQSSVALGLVYNMSGLHDEIESVHVIIGGTVSLGNRFTVHVFVLPLASVEVR